MAILDAAQSRPMEGGPSFSVANRLIRLAWMIAWTLLARWTPRQLDPLRCALARAFGARVERGAMIYGGARIWLPANLSIGRGSTLSPGVNCYNLAPIAIGRETIVSQGAHLCAGSHDHRDPHFQLVARPITIGDRVWIAAEAFVGPGVTVADGSVLSARGCAFADLDGWTIYVGNPAVATKARALRGG